jgi:hypothetical protein
VVDEHYTTDRPREGRGLPGFQPCGIVLNPLLERLGSQLRGGMLDAPNRFLGSRVGGQTWDEMPVGVRGLVAEERVGDFRRLRHACDNSSQLTDFFHELDRSVGTAELAGSNGA